MTGLLDLLVGSGNPLLDMLGTHNDKADSGTLERMLRGMDSPAWSPSFEDVPALAGAEVPQQATKATRDKYMGQRGMRGLSSLAFGIPEIVNDVINAGIRDVDYFTGGGLSGASYDPYQLPSSSQSAANPATEISGADIVPRKAVPPSTQRAGDWVEAGVGMLPIGVGGLAAATGKHMKTLASRSTNIYDPPVKPARAFELDYPSRAKADDTGRLLEDVEGRPLIVRRVVGRNVVGGEDIPVLPSEYDAITEATIGSRPQAVEARALPKGAVGKYRDGYSPEGRPERDIYVLKALLPRDAAKVTAHEMGHMLDQMARKWAKDPAANIPTGMRSELNTIYNDLNNPDLNHALQRGLDVERNPRKVYKGYKPEHQGYKKGQEADEELVAELAQAYLTNPNYVKTIAPRAAKWWRERVNTDPYLKNIIQLNGLATALAPAGLMGYLASHEDEQ